MYSGQGGYNTASLLDIIFIEGVLIRTLTTLLFLSVGKRRCRNITTTDTNELNQPFKDHWRKTHFINSSSTNSNPFLRLFDHDSGHFSNKKKKNILSEFRRAKNSLLNLSLQNKWKFSFFSNLRMLCKEPELE